MTIQTREAKGIQIKGHEYKLSLFADNTIICMMVKKKAFIRVLKYLEILKRY